MLEPQDAVTLETRLGRRVSILLQRCGVAALWTLYGFSGPQQAIKAETALCPQVWYSTPRFRITSVSDPSAFRVRNSSVVSNPSLIVGGIGKVSPSTTLRDGGETGTAAKSPTDNATVLSAGHACDVMVWDPPSQLRTAIQSWLSRAAGDLGHAFAAELIVML